MGSPSEVIQLGARTGPAKAGQRTGYNIIVPVGPSRAIKGPYVSVGGRGPAAGGRAAVGGSVRGLPDA